MRTTSRQCIYHGTFVFCASRTEFSVIRGWLMVDRAGTIVKIVHVDDANGADDVSTEKLILSVGWIQEETSIFEASDNEFFFPGFIDTHIHAPQFPNAGIFGKTTLLDWLKAYTYPMEASLSDVDKAKAVYEACVSAGISHGTTTATYYATIHVEPTKLLADICWAKGQRALIGRVCMDSRTTLVDYYRDESADTSNRDNLAVVHHCRQLDPTGLRVAPILTPRSAVSCSTEQMHLIRDMVANDGLRVQTHLSENLSEIDLVRTVWPAHDNYTAVYDAHGLLTPRTILAHAIYLDKSERSCIAARGAKVSHCPVSNSALGSGMCHVRALMDAGITVGLGSDVSGGYSPSVLEAARQACLVSRLVAAEATVTASSLGRKTTDGEHDRLKLSVEEALWLATRGGADVVGWGDRLGGFRVGMRFDAQLVAFAQVGASSPDTRDLGNYKVFGWESWGDRLAKWLYCADDRNTVRVWVDGELVHSR